MFKEPSLSKISSRSLSKIKTKIEMAFSKPKNNQNESKNQNRAAPSRSYSTKSLTKSKYQTAEKNIPFSIAVKNEMIHTDRKPSYFSGNTQYKAKTQKSENVDRRFLTANHDQIQCQNQTENQVICGYSWYHKNGSQLVSMCKKNKDEMLRYFAIKTHKQSKPVKIVLAALQKDRLYSGSKKFILVKSNQHQLLHKNQLNEVKVSESLFVLVISQVLLRFCNVNRLIVYIHELIVDGLTNLDTISNIIGRKIVESQKKSGLNIQAQEIFILILLVQKEREKYKLISDVDSQVSKKLGG